MSAYLRGPHQDDLTTECGTFMLDDLNKYTRGSDLDSLVERASDMPDDIHSMAGPAFGTPDLTEEGHETRENAHEEFKCEFD